MAVLYLHVSYGITLILSFVYRQTGWSLISTVIIDDRNFDYRISAAYNCSVQ